MRDVNEHTEHPLWRRVARTILPGAVRHRLGTWYGELGTSHLPDRVYLVRELIPAVGRCADKVLSIGCRPYTKHYPGLFGMHGAECWTIDIDPSAARWGAPGRHVTGAIQDSQVHLPASWFDAIVLNGVFGFGLNSFWDQDTALRQAIWAGSVSAGRCVVTLFLCPALITAAAFLTLYTLLWWRWSQRPVARHSTARRRDKCRYVNGSGWR